MLCRRIVSPHVKAQTHERSVGTAGQVSEHYRGDTNALVLWADGDVDEFPFLAARVDPYSPDWSVSYGDNSVVCTIESRGVLARLSVEL